MEFRQRDAFQFLFAGVTSIVLALGVWFLEKNKNKNKKQQGAIEQQKRKESKGQPLAQQLLVPPTDEAELVRLMLPDDANPAGNVHGGTILKLIEQVGFIVAVRHSNSGSGIIFNFFFFSIKFFLIIK